MRCLPRQKPNLVHSLTLLRRGSRNYTRPAHSLPIPPRLSALVTPEDTVKARSWISNFKTQSIPKASVELSFSRSSGPGGQHVNKVNTKATVRCPLDSPWIPEWARPVLKEDPHYVSSTNSILIQSTVYRSQAQNVEDCLSKLHNIILAASSALIKNEPSEEQKKRVAALEQADKARRRREKSYRSDIKKGRSKGGWD
ncbi:putative RF-1 domain containing protein [Lyophyllum shimeji]|uniref:RF-1 domain containing protein n=1 Tax=Lyophyllum shimeji TaxID=47721 RepID=A0A9P3PS24_LYOSH|nr:putative RF-1 domain containing protein [Lyophyllum shimeji]